MSSLTPLFVMIDLRAPLFSGHSWDISSVSTALFILSEREYVSFFVSPLFASLLSFVYIDLGLYPTVIVLSKDPNMMSVSMDRFHQGLCLFCYKGSEDIALHVSRVVRSGVGARISGPVSRLPMQVSYYPIPNMLILMTRYFKHMVYKLLNDWRRPFKLYLSQILRKHDTNAAPYNKRSSTLLSRREKK